jgi:threonine synthase
VPCELPFITSLCCLRCGREFAPEEIEYVCGCRPNRGSDLGTLDVQFDYTTIGRRLSPREVAADPDRSLGRFWPLLPLSGRSSLPPLAVGDTPLLATPRLGSSLGLSHL